MIKIPHHGSQPGEVAAGLWSALRTWRSSLRHGAVHSRRLDPATQVEWSPRTGLLILDWSQARTGFVRSLSPAGKRHGLGDGPCCQIEIMPGSRDPGLPVLDADVDGAKPWRERIPVEVRQIRNRFSCGRQPLLHGSSRSREALDLLCSEPRLLCADDGGTGSLARGSGPGVLERGPPGNSCGQRSSSHGIGAAMPQQDSMT